MKIGNIILRQPTSCVLASAAIPFWQLKQLKKFGVSQVIDLNYRDSFVYRSKGFMEHIICILHGIKYKNIPIRIEEMADLLRTKKLFQIIHKFISTGKKLTHVHCLAGLHRTGIVCAGEQILSGEKSLPETITYLEKHHYWTSQGKTVSPTINPKRYNTYFKLLKAFEALFTTKSN